MEIIKNNYFYEKNKEITVHCKHCNSILKCTQYEYEHLPCPCCGLPFQEVHEAICDNCNNQFTYSPEECDTGAYGLYTIKCPECNHTVELNEGIDLTTENLEEKHFSNFSDGVDINFDTIKKWIKRGIDYLNTHTDEYMYYTSGGNTFVLVHRDDDEFYVMYTNNYNDVYLRR